MRRLALLALLFSLTPPAAHAFPVQLQPNYVRGFRIVPGMQEMVGFVTGLTIGSVNVSADIATTNPVNGQALLAVGVLSQVRWSGNALDPLRFELHVSSTNADRLRAFQTGNPVGVPVSIAFTVYALDLAASAYIPLFQASAGSLRALLDSSQGVVVAASPDTVVLNPRNFAAQFGLIPPASGRQILLYSPRANQSIQMPWGR